MVIVALDHIQIRTTARRIRTPLDEESASLSFHILLNYVAIIEDWEYRRTPVSTGNTFQDLPRLRETADNTERYT